MRTKLLIELVRVNPVLYDTNHEDYVRTKLKDEIWNNIAKELDYACGQAPREQWRKLRDCHRDALRRQKRKSGQGGTVTKMWTYQKQMEFLLPFMGNRLAVNIDDSVTEVSAESLYKEDDTCADDLRFTKEEIDLKVPSKMEEPSISYTSNRKMKKMDDTNLMRYFFDLKHYEQMCKESDVLRKRAEENNEAEKDCALYQFFMSMYNTTKNMPKSSQLRIKKKLFEAISEAEEELMANPCTQPPGSWPPSSAVSSPTQHS